MSTTITAGALTIEVLAAGEELDGGASVAAGQIAVRVDGHEFAGRPDQVAELGRQLYQQLSNVTLPSRTWQILLVGDAVAGHEFYGPFSREDPGGRASARLRALEINEQGHVQADLLPLEELAPIDPDPAAAATPTAVTADVDVPGVGTLKAGATYLATVANGATVNAYALVGRELIEADGFHADRTPIWSTASICEPDRGEADFYYPAVALLRFLNDHSDLPVWHHTIRAEFDAAFTMYGAQRLIAGWYHDPVSGGYRITVWQPNDTTTQVVLRTPDQTTAFIAGLQAASNAQPATR